MPERLLLDTDVLAGYLRGQQKAVEFLERIESPPFMSATAVADLFVGAKGGEEKALEKFLRLSKCRR